MGFSEIVPGNQLCYSDRRAIPDQHLPSFGKQPVVATVDEIFIVRVLSVML